MADNTTQNAYQKLLAAQQAKLQANPISAKPAVAPVAQPVVTPAPSAGTSPSTTGTSYTEANFPYEQFLAANPSLQSGTVDSRDKKRAYDAYVAQGRSWSATPAASTSTVQPVAGAATPTQGTQIVPGVTTAANQMNVADAAGQLVTNPSLLVNGASSLATQVPTVDGNATGTTVNPNDPKFQAANGPNATTATVGSVAQAGAATGDRTAATYTADQSYDKVAAQDMKGAVGSVNPQAVIDAEKIKLDVNAFATGKNPDGTVNAAGVAMNQAAQQNIVNVIDTSTMAGKILADSLGEGNYTDSKATLKGQLDILSAEFANPDGSAKIPSWAQGAARNVSKIASFSGMTGTAATSAMATAIMEASIPVAAADATFFQTLTVKNLDNRQEQTINKANILSKMEMQNADMRMTAAIQNSQNFMQMDLANLANEQQARVINTQSRVQSILEDSKAINTQRMFTAQSQNEKDMFYSNLDSSISQFNAAQVNGMAQFNASEVNSTSKFNSSLENSRQEFYKNMQYQIDTSNAAWRQTVTTTNASMQFEAAATDVKNRIGVSVEQLNQLWDRSDALLDYTWKTSDNEKERAQNLLIAQMQITATAKLNAANNKAKSQDSLMTGIGSVAGSVIGNWAGSESGSSSLSKLFGF